MPVYLYTALSPQGRRVRGEAVAVSADDLRQTLSRDGLLVREIRERRAGLPFRRGVSPESLLLLNQEFLALIRAGLTIPEALKLAANRPESPVLTQALSAVLEDVRQGVSLSEACARHPVLFEAPYLATLRTGEKTGNLVRALEKYQEHLRQRVAIRRKVSQALAYPAFLMALLLAILLLLFTFVLPRFVAMYADFGAQLPVPTRMLIAVVDVLPYLLPVLLIGGIALWTGWRRWRLLPAVQARLESWRNGLPVVGGIVREATAAQLARTLSALLAGGTPLVEALQVTTRSLSGPQLTARLQQVTREVREGKPLAEALRGTGLLPETAIRLVQVGEASGSLDRMLDEAAQFHEESLAHRLTRMMALIEPLMMLLMGILVGGIIVVMYLPVFYIMDVIK